MCRLLFVGKGVSSFAGASTVVGCLVDFLFGTFGYGGVETAEADVHSVRVTHRSISPQWGEIPLRQVICTCAPCGPSVRVDALAKV